MSTANEEQIDGSHYLNLKIQTWDYIVQNQIPYLEGNIIKYVSRWRAKNGMTDLLKAQHYLTKLIETEHERLGNVAAAGGAAKSGD
jgi:hypothetical protein